MKAIVITGPGGPEVLRLQERPLPACAGNEVLVRVMAAGVNRPDVYQRLGQYPPPPWTSADIPGLEIAGIVEATGSPASRWRKGDHICALVSGGGYAEYCAVPDGQCLPVPPGLDFIGAASLPETFFTVWTNVFDRAGLKPQESLLVHGGAGGIGIAAIQMARSLGSTVYATAGTPEKCRLCESLGAGRAINYRTEDFSAMIGTITGGRGVDVILDMIGAPYTGANLRSLADEGRLVEISTMKGKEAQVDLSLIMRKRLTITGSTLRSRDTPFKSAVASKLEAHIWPLLASGAIKPLVQHIFPLAEAALAHELMENGRHTGKIVLSLS